MSLLKFVSPVGSFLKHGNSHVIHKMYQNSVSNVSEGTFVGNVTRHRSSAGDVDIANRFAKLCRCSLIEARIVYCEAPFLGVSHLRALESHGEKLNQKRFAELCNVLLRNRWILNGTAQELTEKLNYLSNVGVNPVNLLFLKSGSKLTCSHESVSERIEYFRTSLKCSAEDVVNMFDKHRFLISMNMDRLHRVMKLLLDNKVSPEHIRTDLWTFSRSEDRMKQRLEVAQSVKLSPIKPWMLRCSSSVFDKLIKKWQECNDILGEHDDLFSYMCDRLNCSRDVVSDMVDRFPALLNVNVPKVKQLLDCLLQYGYTAEDIRRFPFVFNYRVTTVKIRYTELKSISRYPIYLHYLCVNTSQYRQLVRKIKQSGKYP